MLNNLSTKHQKPIVFFDGSCALCSREIGHYQHLDGTQSITWIDIADDPPALKAHDIDWIAAMERLHVIDGEGRLHTGVEAFLALWKELPYYRWLAKTIVLTRMTPALEWCYVRFARWRLARRCKQGSCVPGLVGDTQKGHTGKS